MVAPSTSKTSSKKGKENAPPPRSKGKAAAAASEASDDELVQYGDDTFDEPPKKAGVKAGKNVVLEEDGVDGGAAELKRRLKAVSAERDRLRTQRDTFAKQFEELSKLRSSATEELFAKFRETAELASKTQNDIIANQAALTDKLQARVRSLEKDLARESGVFEKADPKEIRALKEELAKVRKEGKARDEELLNLQREYKTEVELSRSLQASARAPAAAPSGAAAAGAAQEEAEKDVESLKLYEDLTTMNIYKVTLREGKLGSEKTFNCIMEGSGPSLNFKLLCFNEPDRETRGRYIKSVHYTPQGLENEKKEFVDRLGEFAEVFVIPREQLGGFFRQLNKRMWDEGGEEE
ncbi:hypothetical protein IAT38_003469 [Cryptococcus sp. DSM 104549]